MKLKTTGSWLGHQRTVPTQSELLLEPAFAVELGSVAAFVDFVLEFGFGVTQQKSNGLSQTANLPISQNRHFQFIELVNENLQFV